MVRNQKQAVREIALQTAVFGLPELATHALVAADPHNGRRPPLCHGCDEQAEVLLGDGHPGIVPILAVKV